MSGSREKTLRQRRGISIAARRAEARFVREIEAQIDAGLDKRAELRTDKRRFYAWAGLALMAALIVLLGFSR